MAPRSAIEFTPEDEGKPVVTESGDVVGDVVRCEDGTAFVRPRRELVAGYGSRLTGCWDASELFQLDASAVVPDTSGRIKIKPEERPEPDTLPSTE